MQPRPPHGYRPPGSTPAKTSDTLRWVLIVGGVVALTMFGGCFLLLIASTAIRGSHAARAEPDPTPLATESTEPARPSPAKSKSTATGRGCPKTDADVQVACHIMVENRLTAPSTAEWPGMFSGDHATLHPDCSVTYTSWVDHTNAFGVKVRSHFTCRYDPKTDDMSLDLD